MFKNIVTVTKEIWENRRRAYNLAKYSLKAEYGETLFGFFWNFFNPALQVLVYWFVFAIGLKHGAPKGEYSYLIWLVVGVVPWFSTSGGIRGGATSIISFSNVLKRMYFPMAAVPFKAVLTSIIEMFWGMLLTIAFCLVSGVSLSLTYLQIPYYMLCTMCLLTALAYITSSISIVFRDFVTILTAIIRLLFYTTPILWSVDKIDNPTLLFIMKLNPFKYICDGFRNSILYPSWFWEHPAATAYFWILTIVLYILGCQDRKSVV